MTASDGASRSAGPLAAALAVLAAAAGALAAAMLRATGGRLIYPLDDTYIQMAIAKNLAAHGVWGVTRFDFSGAGSSPLWPLLLAGLDRATGLAARLPLLTNLAAAAAVLAVADAGLRRQTMRARPRLLTLVAIVIATPLPALALVGMEHTLQCAVTLALALAGVALCTVDPRADDRRLTAAVAILGGLTIAVRYDSASVVAPLILVIAATRGWRRAAPLALASAVPVVAYAVMAWRHGWPMLPAPVLLKQRLWGVSLFSWHGAADVFGGGALAVLLNTPALLVLVIVAAALAVLDRGGMDRAARESRLLLLLFLVATAVHLQFGRVGWLHRYEAYLIALGIVAIACAAARGAVSPWPVLAGARRIAAAALLLVLASPLLQRAVLASRDVVTSADDLARHEYSWSQFFRLYPPAGGLLASDIGAVSYFSDVPIVDATGLATFELLPARWTDPVDVPRAAAIARARGIRVSIIDGPLGGPLTGWACVAAWTTAGDTTPNATIWLSAADEEAAGRLAHDLRAFQATHPAGFSLRFADERGGCSGS